MPRIYAMFSHKENLDGYVAEHCINSGHNIDWSNVEIIAKIVNISSKSIVY